MTRNILRISILGILLASLAAVAVSALSIPPGKDYWVTPANNKTFVTFPDGDVEALCGASPSSLWNHVAVFQGVPPSTGPAYDTVVARLDTAVFNSSGEAQTRIQVVDLNFVSSAPQRTPCGDLTWKAKLAGTQGITTMGLHATSSAGGYFNADLSVKAELEAFSGGTYIGSVFYDFILPDPSDAGTPWSLYKEQFRAGMTETDDCIAVLREKLSTYPVKSDHYYYISDMIAQGRCKDR